MRYRKKVGNGDWVLVEIVILRTRYKNSPMERRYRMINSLGQGNYIDRRSFWEAACLSDNQKISHTITVFSDFFHRPVF
jgi:hypothetical protein